MWKFSQDLKRRQNKSDKKRNRAFLFSPQPRLLIYEWTPHYCLLLIAIKLYHSSMQDDISPQVDILPATLPPSMNSNNSTASKFEC